jgi:hypothetical protein
MFLGTFDPASTRADWTCVVSLVDNDTDEPLDIGGASIVVEVRDRLSGSTVLSLNTANAGVSMIDTGTFQIDVPATSMRTLRSDTYEIGGTYTINGATRQFVIGLLPILDGIVS